ncbi:MAG: glycosyltransferase family 2 protein [Gemmiger sp.]|nr:glycosyltransferase family 2 protein [Gemmiger sp.]
MITPHTANGAACAAASDAPAAPGPTPCPTLCVIVPVYNAAATLARCVDSILSQTVAGGLCCVLVDDASTDESPALCDHYAATDPRVTVCHHAPNAPDLGVSSARNTGLAPARGEYIVFLDSDDCLLPGALQAALDAQHAAPQSFILWHYTTTLPAAPPPCRPGTLPYPASALGRLYLDCLVAMPWNKLYRAAYAKCLRFNTAYTLGEDLQFVLDYIALLGQKQPGFTYAVVADAFTFYDCSKTDGTLSTRYLPDYCPLWCTHFGRLNAACADAGIPQADLLPLHRAELAVLAEGVADILRRDAAPLGLRRDKAVQALCHPWLRGLLAQMKAEGCYSPYYLPVWWRNLHLLYTLAEAKRTGSALYGKLDWLGYYLFLGRRKRA